MASQLMGSEDTQTAIVGLTLQVLLARDGESWVAQSMEIDYAAAGDSVEDVKRRFEEGLRATIQVHFSIFGHLDNFLQPPTRDLLWGLQDDSAQLHRYRQMSLHQFSTPIAFPFGQISYVAAAQECEPA